jgi:hypothetical protein
VSVLVSIKVKDLHNGRRRCCLHLLPNRTYVARKADIKAEKSMIAEKWHFLQSVRYG